MGKTLNSEQFKGELIDIIRGKASYFFADQKDPQVAEVLREIAELFAPQENKRGE